MAPLRWGVRDPDGAASGNDGRPAVRDAYRIQHREEDFILTPQKRPGPVFQSSDGRWWPSLAAVDGCGVRHRAGDFRPTQRSALRPGARVEGTPSNTVGFTENAVRVQQAGHSRENMRLTAPMRWRFRRPPSSGRAAEIGSPLREIKGLCCNWVE